AGVLVEEPSHPNVSGVVVLPVPRLRPPPLPALDSTQPLAFGRSTELEQEGPASRPTLPSISRRRARSAQRARTWVGAAAFVVGVFGAVVVLHRQGAARIDGVAFANAAASQAAASVGRSLVGQARVSSDADAKADQSASPASVERPRENAVSQSAGDEPTSNGALLAES